MSHNGIEFPSVIDLVTNGDESVQLILVETRPLTKHDAPALQVKLNTYLSYALDGGLATQFPVSASKPTCIRVDLYAQPDAFILDFFRAYSCALIEHGVSFEAHVNGEALA